MCDFENGFILCTCTKETQKVVHNKNSRRYKNTPEAKIVGYRWVLARFVRTFEPIMEGMYAMPSHDLGAGLTAEWVLMNLNYGNCFDFDYTPAEGDNLVFRSDERWDYMSFIFRQGAWQEGRYDGFSTTLEALFHGQIKTLPTE